MSADLDSAIRAAEEALAKMPPGDRVPLDNLWCCYRALRALLDAAKESGAAPRPRVVWRDGEPFPCAASPAPLPPAVADDPVYAWARLAVALLKRHSSAWDHDPGPGDDGCDEDCRACEYESLLRTGRAALDAQGGPR